jgi:hypothetical protein
VHFSEFSGGTNWSSFFCMLLLVMMRLTSTKSCSSHSISISEPSPYGKLSMGGGGVIFSRIGYEGHFPLSFEMV